MADDTIELPQITITPGQPAQPEPGSTDQEIHSGITYPAEPPSPPQDEPGTLVGKIEQRVMIPARHQGPRRHAAVWILVDGVDITSRLHPYLISVQVVDNMDSPDKCSIELDDRNAELQLPPNGVRLIVAMGWANEGPRIPDRGRFSVVNGKVIGLGPQGPQQVPPGFEMPWGGPGMEQIFEGTVDQVESGFGRRGGGRRVWIDATSGNMLGAAKAPQQDAVGEGNPDDSATDGGRDIPLQEAADKFFGKLGIKVKLSPEMAKLKRKRWDLGGSPNAWAKALASAAGGTFKLINNVAVFTGRGEGTNVDGMMMPTVSAQWGVNLIGWRIQPYSGRPEYQATISNYFDIFQASFNEVKKAIPQFGGAPFGGSNAIMKVVQPVVDKAVAGQSNNGVVQESLGARGHGWVLINGEPGARAHGHISIENARPGVDGLYQITEAEHIYTRGVGYTTRCVVKYPIPKSGFKWARPVPIPEQKKVEPDDKAKTDPRLPMHYTWTPEELEALRNEYRARGEPLPESLTQTTDPAGPGYVSAEYLEMTRQYYEGTAEQQAAARTYFANLANQFSLTPGQRRSRQLNPIP